MRLAPAAFCRSDVVARPGALGLRGRCLGVRGTRNDHRQLRPKSEKVVATALERNGVGYYLPLVPVVRTYAKCRVTFLLPLFPGYVFLRGDHDDCEKAWRTNRVAKILRVENQERLRTELQQVNQALEAGEKVDLFKSLKKGRHCRITGGSLRGLEGVVLRRGRHCRMYLSVTILGQSAVVEVDAALLEPID
jgi:transcription antitermination factor NusG